MKQSIVGLVSGLLFAVGLGVSGMTDPQKIIHFLDFTGAWDPSLAFVMVGAIGVHFIAQRALKGVRAPMFAGRFEIAQKRQLDWKLVTGAALFGVGWGASGYCPGPTIVSVGAGARGAIVLGLGMLLGIGVYRLVFSAGSSARNPDAGETPLRPAE